MNRPAHLLVRDAAERYLRLARLSGAEQFDHVDLRSLLVSIAERLGFGDVVDFGDDTEISCVDANGILFVGLPAPSSSPSESARVRLGALFRELRDALDRGRFIGVLCVAATTSLEAARSWAAELSRHAEDARIHEVRDESFVFETGPLPASSWAAFLAGVL